MLTDHQRSLVTFKLGQFHKPSIAKIHLKITYLKFHSKFPGDNELISLVVIPCVQTLCRVADMWNCKSELIMALWHHILWQRSGSILVQIMVCCLVAPSHYLNQCILIICKVLRHSPESNFTASAQTTILNNEFENYSFKVTPASPRGQWVSLIFLVPFVVVNFRWCNYDYRKISIISRTKFQNLNDSRLVLHLSLPNLLKPGVK